MPLVPIQLVGDSAKFGQVMEVSNLAAEKVLIPGAAPATAGVVAPGLSILKQTVLATQFTDGTAEVGTLTMSSTLPAGAMVLACVITAVTGFAGDVSCTMTVGDGSDVDRYMTGTPDVFTSAPMGPSGQDGRVSGVAFARTAVAPVITITSASDITPVIADAGAATISIYYIAAGL